MSIDTILWTKIEAYNLDYPIREYGFSARLAKENYWTKAFTEKAILEYKKFMFLAGTSDMMVSPSETVDIVWHQHLIYTLSYTDFCELIGKSIQHIPSTHNKEDSEKFRQAKERTKRLYTAAFGPQPEDVWEYSGMYEVLELKKARFKIRTAIIAGLLIFATAITPCYFLLQPIYIHFGSPLFLMSYVFIALAVFLLLETVNRNRLSTVVRNFKEFAFTRNLHPMELVYLKTGQLADVIHGSVSQLVEKRVVVVNFDKTIQLNKHVEPDSVEEYVITETVLHRGKVTYSSLLKDLMEKEVFSNVANCMDALRKYIMKSRLFAWLFYMNLFLLLLVEMLGVIRLLTGLVNGKPVFWIVIVLIIITVVIMFYLSWLTDMACNLIIPRFYKKELLPSHQNRDTWEWKYFLVGMPLIAPFLAPLVNDLRKGTGGDSGSDSSGGSSCGSSCSSCGGCGGD